MQNISTKFCIFVFLAVNLIGCPKNTAAQYKQNDPDILRMVEDCGVNPYTNNSGDIELVEVILFEQVNGMLLEQQVILDIIEMRPMPALKNYQNPTSPSKTSVPVISKSPVTINQFVIFLNALDIKADGMVSDSTNLSGTRFIDDVTNGERLGIKFLDGEWVVSSRFEDGPFLHSTWEGASLFAEFIGGRLPTFMELKYLSELKTGAGWLFNNYLVISSPNSTSHLKNRFHVIVE